MKKGIILLPKTCDDIVYVTAFNCSHLMKAVKMLVWREFGKNYDTSKNKEVILTSE